MSSTSPSAGNAGQREHWNTLVGPKWVGLADVLDRQMQEIAALLLRSAAPAPGESVLDIGCGPGSMMLEIAKAVGERGRVLGIDISEPMLDAARQRIAASGRANISVLLADAASHRFGPERCDLLFSRFGVMFFDDPVAAFRNIRSAGRAGGRLCFVCWGPLAENMHWSLPLEIAIRHLGALDPKPPHAPGPLAFSDARYLRAVLEGAGFDGITITEERPKLLGTTAEAAAELATTMGPAAGLVTERQPAANVLQAIRDEIAAAFARYATPGWLELPALVHMVHALVPSETSP